MSILSHSDKVTQLMLDERWHGAESVRFHLLLPFRFTYQRRAHYYQDEDALEQEHLAHLARLKAEEEARVLAEQQEHERREQEHRDREEREERERVEKEKAAEAAAASASRGAVRGSGVRGVRGTRASMRGMAARGGATARGGSFMPRFIVYPADEKPCRC